jgi:predicted PurR-regulated permease PerM
MALILLAVLTAVVIFIIGFSKHGVNFLKYGFQQKNITDLGEKIDGLDTRLTNKINDLGNEFHTELEAIKVNHFGHLKNFLSELTSILLDKNIINNTEKTRLDNQLRDM